MPTTTAVFKFQSGEEIYHSPVTDNLLSTIPFFSDQGVSDSNKVSDTIDVENCLRTVVRSWPNISMATEFVTSLQAEKKLIEYPGWPGQLVSVQVDPE